MRLLGFQKKTFELMLLYIAVGIVVSLGVIAFQQILSLLNELIMKGLAGYTDIVIVNGGGWFSLPWARPELRVWLFPVLAGSGGLIVGLIIHGLAPEAAGHGTDKIIDAYRNKAGSLTLRVSLAKTLASVITLGSGGSGGQVGPIGDIGASISSYICTNIPAYRDHRAEIMLAGMAAAVAAIFWSPLAGAIFAAEILNSDMRYNGRVLIPAAIASTASYGVYALLFGFEPMLRVQDFVYEFAPGHLIAFSLLGMFSAIAAIFFVKLFYTIRNLLRLIPIPAFLRPALGGVLMGTLCMAFPEALGEGSFHLQRIISGQLALQAMVIIVVVKMLTTSLTIGSGGSAGVFGPSLFVGAALGGSFAGLYAMLVPETTIPAVVFILLGMAGFFAGAANAPVSTVIIVAEMTSSHTLFVPLLWVSVFGYIFSQGWNIYENQTPIRRNVLETTGYAERKESNLTQ